MVVPNIGLLYTDRVEYHHFENDVKKDLKHLEAVYTKRAHDASFLHTIKSSNLPFMQAVWDAAKRATDVVGLKRHSSAVDVVAEGGLRWIKVYNLTEKRLLIDMAKEGWDWDDSSDEGEDDAASKTRSDDNLQIPLLKMAESLVAESKKTKVRTFASYQ